ncbi:19546_t:CDS:2 [Gigaspora margarita]|uniref:19546_t:CDS:1 n=1 Tax=Gigaspora margarita TaxID=4874 RepID=A0ABN7ULU2_GIGMA|nr:19546_t:CDS:2 [Gigaspora margarita]
MCVGQSLALSWYFLVQLISCNTKGENKDKVNAETASMAKETNGSNEVNANGVNKTNGINGVNKTNEINGLILKH